MPDTYIIYLIYMYVLKNVCNQDVFPNVEYEVYYDEVLTLELRTTMHDYSSPEMLYDLENLKADQIRKEFPETWLFQNTEKYDLKFYNI